MAQVVIAADGRRLSVETLGAPEGKPVFLFHGTPGARNGPRPRGIVLYRLGIKLICHDRPGYGDSDRQHGRTVGHIASDIAEIADSLGIDTFSVVGRSGGGPHALACAALLRGRVECAAALGSLAPIDAEGLDWWDGMVESNVRAYRTGEDQLELMADARPRNCATIQRVCSGRSGQSLTPMTGRSSRTSGCAGSLPKRMRKRCKSLRQAGSTM